VLQYIQALHENGSLIGQSDRQVLDRFIEANAQGDRVGSELALATLLERHAPMVWQVCRALVHGAHDAEDAFQATFLILVRKAASVNRERVMPSHRIRRKRPELLRDNGNGIGSEIDQGRFTIHIQENLGNRGRSGGDPPPRGGPDRDEVPPGGGIYRRVDLEIRTFDFTVEPGRTYRYRARVVVYYKHDRRFDLEGEWSAAADIVTIP
jgi:hypothetical protein